VKAQLRSGHFAERIVEGRNDSGESERILIWIERRAGAIWAVGRIVDPEHRQSEEPRETDYVWQGYELEDCLEEANAALEDDVVVTEEDGGDGHATRPFRRDELLEPLERFFFGR
jgi:hypothetical protein